MVGETYQVCRRLCSFHCAVDQVTTAPEGYRKIAHAKSLNPRPPINMDSVRIAYRTLIATACSRIPLLP